MFETKIEKGFNFLRGKRVLVAFSGGVDSTVVASIASEVAEVLLITIVSDWISSEEIAEAKKIAGILNLPHSLLKVEINDNHFWSNPPDRCYVCKKNIFGTLLSYAKSNGYDIVVDGTNTSDMNGHRPGLKALSELGVYSPLLVAGFTKPEIRDFAKDKSLLVANKPAMACLASRVPYGNSITTEKLRRIELGEKYIRELNILSTFRLRDHDELARIEIDLSELNLFMKREIIEDISSKLKKIGYKYVTIDLNGYRPSIPL